MVKIYLAEFWKDYGSLHERKNTEIVKEMMRQEAREIGVELKEEEIDIFYPSSVIVKNSAVELVKIQHAKGMFGHTKVPEYIFKEALLCDLERYFFPEILKCDILVACRPSYEWRKGVYSMGVGYELAYAKMKGKRVIEL